MPQNTGVCCCEHSMFSSWAETHCCRCFSRSVATSMYRGKKDGPLRSAIMSGIAKRQNNYLLKMNLPILCLFWKERKCTDLYSVSANHGDDGRILILVEKHVNCTCCPDKCEDNFESTAFIFLSVRERGNELNETPVSSSYCLIRCSKFIAFNICFSKNCVRFL